VHRDGDWHAAIHIWLLSTAYEAPALVLQRRSATKDTWPGRLDVAVGGHVRAGETIRETMREAEEELGLRLSPDELQRVGRRFSRGATDNEVQESFAAVVDLPLAALRLHPQEVDAVVRLALADAWSLLVEGLAVDAFELSRGERDERSVRLGASEVVPVRDGYYRAALRSLDAIAAGEPVVPFDLR
jgi:isopentenyldiphosphate isomerase